MSATPTVPVVPVIAQTVPDNLCVVPVLAVSVPVLVVAMPVLWSGFIDVMVNSLVNLASR